MMRDRRLALACLAALTAACSSGPSSHESSTDAGADGTSLDGGGNDATSGTDASPGADGAGEGGLGSCAPNATLPCTCAAAGAVGIQQCLPDGSAWRACLCQTYGTQIAVSPTGDDTAAGTLAAPFRTLGRAQTAVRALVDAGPPVGDVVVWLRNGTYPLTQTFALTAADSGSSTSAIVWSGYPGETADLVGGTALPSSAFTALTSASPVWSRLDPAAQGQVLVANLPALGVTDYGTLQERGFCHSGSTAALELPSTGQRCRWRAGPTPPRPRPRRRTEAPIQPASTTALPRSPRPSPRRSSASTAPVRHAGRRRRTSGFTGCSSTSGPTATRP